MTVFVLAENAAAARDLCAGARTLGDVALVSLTPATRIAGIADVVYAIDVPADALIESASPAVVKLVSEKAPEIVLVEPTRRMKVIAAKIAYALGTSVVPDVKALENGVASTLYFGGVAVRKQKVAGATAIYTASAATFGDVAPATGTDVIETVAYEPCGCGAKLVSRSELPKAGVDLTAAKRIVAAGRGFGAEEELSLARDFAAKVGAEVGCTRPLTEAENWFPREAYIGVSGLMLSPEVYFGVGVSGQMQHMVGVNTAKTIFAVNKDKNAPIFAQADYGLIGDIKTVLPQIIAKL